MAFRTFSFACKWMSLACVLAGDVPVHVIANSPYTTSHLCCDTSLMVSTCRVAMMAMDKASVSFGSDDTFGVRKTLHAYAV